MTEKKTKQNGTTINKQLCPDLKKVEPNKYGQEFEVGTHVVFEFQKQTYQGVVQKQLKNAAIIDFSGASQESELAQDLKQKIVISYTDLAKSE